MFNQISYVRSITAANSISLPSASAIRSLTIAALQLDLDLDLSPFCLCNQISYDRSLTARSRSLSLLPLQSLELS